MKYMVTWKIPPGTYNAALGKFLETGGPVPEGLTSLGRWHAPGSMYGWHLVEGSESALAEMAVAWASSLELEVTPVIDDEAAGAAGAKVLGG